MGQYHMHAGHRERRALVDRHDPRMRMRRAQQFDVQRAFHGDIESISRRASHDLRPCWRGQAAAERGAGGGIFDVVDPVQRVLDGAIAGAATQIAFQRRTEILPLRLVQRRTGQDHAGGAETALKRLRVEKCLLHRVRGAVRRETLDGGDGATFGAERGNDAAMHRLAVEQHGTCAAVAGVAAFLDAEMPEFAQQRPQALACMRLRGKLLAIDLKTHRRGTLCNSARISSASRSVMCLRHAGLP